MQKIKSTTSSNLPRRSWLLGLLAAPAALFWTAGSRRASAASSAFRSCVINRCHLAGFQYYAGPKLLDHLTRDTALQLVAEPDNPHDHYAVRVAWRGRKLGYLPRTDNRHISRMLRGGIEVQASVLEKQLDEPPWRQLHVALRVRTAHSGILLARRS